jgi:hypothetical protein
VRRLVCTPHSDVRLLGRSLTHGRAWPVAGLALHLANGAVFGALFERAGLGGVKTGVLAAEAENILLWPAPGRQRTSGSAFPFTDAGSSCS